MFNNVINLPMTQKYLEFYGKISKRIYAHIQKMIGKGYYSELKTLFGLALAINMLV